MKQVAFRIVWICVVLCLLSACGTKRPPVITESGKGDLDGVREQIAQGASVNETDDFQNTALMLSAEAGHLEVVEYLLQHGADVNRENKLGFTALALACEHFYIDVAKILLEKGAHINAGSSTGQTVLMRVARLGNQEMVSFLLQNGADPNQPDNNGMSSIFPPIIENNLELLKLLIQYGADLNVKAQNGLTPIMSAAYHQSLEVFNFLMERESDINRLTKEGYSALTYAAMGAGDLSKKFDPSIMERLISAGASASIKDVKGRSIIELAENETKYFERKMSKKWADENEKKARGMDQMAAANFASAFSNLGLFSSLSTSPRVEKIKAVLDSAPQ